jgi:CubicO group peptidase (beta-lactamase class C family)
VTKVYTATVVMQLVDEGSVDLDAPVVRYVPELVLEDPSVADAITIRALLTHTTGLDLGDVFGPFGEDDDCVARYVEGVGPVGCIHEPGEMFSYTNGGFIILGRVIESVTGQSWDEALRSKLLEPLGLSDTITVLEEDVVRGTGSDRLARGHDVSAIPVVLEPMAHVWGRSTAPAGSTLSATASDVVRFAAFHIGHDRDGVLARGLRVQMQQKVMPNPTYAAYGHGIGWGTHDASATPCIAHGGGHYGQAASLVAVPHRGFALATLTNSAMGAVLHGKLSSRLKELYLGIKTSGAYVEDEPDAPESLEPFVGTYTRRSSVGQPEPIRFSLELGEGGLSYGADNVLARATPTTFTSGGAAFRFMRFDSVGRPRYAHVGNRAFRHTWDD